MTRIIYQIITETTKYENGSSNSHDIIKRVYTEPCTTCHFGELSSTYAWSGELGLYCIAQNQPEIDYLNVEGDPLSTRYSKVVLLVTDCEEENPNNTCLPKPTTQGYLEGAQAILIYTNMAPNLFNYTHPYTRYYSSFQTTLSYDKIELLSFELGHVGISSNSGLFSKEIKTEDFVRMNNMQQTSVIRNISDNSLENPLMFVCFELSRLDGVYQRSYKKFPAVLAEVSSLVNTVLLVFAIILSPYLKLKFRESLMNEMFTIHLKQPVVSKERRQKHKNHKGTIKNLTRKAKKKWRQN